jgi:hypothetical protein
MPARLGIDLTALLEAPVSTTTVPSSGSLQLPPSIARFIARLSVLSYDATVADNRFVYNGLIQTSIFQDLGEDAESDDWPLRIPGLFETGLPFRFFGSRVSIAAGENLEAIGDDWVLQIATQGLSVVLPFQPANFVPETAIRPAYLTPGTGNETILHVDTGVVEISSLGDVLVRPDFTLSPNPYTGAQVKFRFDPEAFFVVDDAVGIRSGDVILDLSELVSPSVAERAGFGPAFKGVYLAELGVYFPPDTPFVVPKSIVLRDALIGTGFAGEGIVEFAAQRDAPPIPTFVDREGTTITIGANNTVGLPTVATDGVLSSTLFVIAVADAREPWAARQGDARWVLPDGSRLENSRTEVLAVRPGDMLEYYYDPPITGPTYEAPERQTFTFDVADGSIFPSGAKARIQLVVEGTAPEAERIFFDVTHINAPASKITGFTLRPVDEEGSELGVLLDSFWWVNNILVPPAADGRIIVNLAEYVDSAPARVPEEEAAGRITAERTSLKITLVAHGISRSLILDVLGDPRLDSFNPVIVGKRSITDDDWHVYEINGPQPTVSIPTVKAPVKKAYHFGSVIVFGRLDKEKEFDARKTAEVPSGPMDSDLVCNLYAPGFVYELFPTQDAVIESRPVPRPKQISLFFNTDQSRESELDGVAVRFDSQDAHLTIGAGGQSAEQVVRDALDGLEEGALVVVGRSSTSSTIRNATSRQARNRELATQRAETGRRLVARILEDTDRAGDITLNARREELPQTEEVATHDHDLQNSEVRYGDRLEWDNPTPDHGVYQRVDIFITYAASADGPEWTPSTEEFAVNQVRRALLPCPRRPSGAPIAYSLDDSSLKRLRACVRWDRHPMPTKMELLAVIRTASVDVGAGSTDSEEQIDALDIHTEEDLWRIILRLLYDARSGAARWSFTLDAAETEDGLAKVGPMPPGFGTVLVFGPLFARMAQAEADDSEVNAAGWVALSTLTALAAVAEATGAIDQVKWILNGVSGEIETRDGPFRDVDGLYLKLDYSVEFRVKVDLLGIETEESHPVRLRFRNVGVAYRRSTGEFQFLFEESATGDFAVEDAGNFIQGPDSSSVLGSLVQVVGARLGQGSVFIELDLRFVIDIGLLEITQTTIRLVFGDDGFKVQLRGLGIKIEIPETLKGEGSLVIRDDGFRATLALEIIPVELYAAGSLLFSDQGDFSSVAVGLLVEFPVGLPLGGSGLGIFGLLGSFAANMRREVGTSGERIANELQWLGRLLNPAGDVSPWAPQRESWAFGVGAIVGTLPDGGKSFHAKGALVLEIPGPTVLFGIDARFISKRRETEGSDDIGNVSSSTDLRIRGLIVITPDAFIIGIQVNFSLGDLLTITIPISALFPTNLSDLNRPSGYLRIGSDGVVEPNTDPRLDINRAGDAVTVSLDLADFLELDAFCFLMIEERGLKKLGQKDFLNFTGFSIGFGMGISLFLGVREIGTYVEVELLALAGMGTSPIVIGGFISASGEISILWISFTIEATLEFLHRQKTPMLPAGQRGTDPIDAPMTSESETTFQGQFCAEISFFFFSVSACFDFKFGDGDPCLAPPPPPLISGLGFVDRRGFEFDRVTLDDDGAQDGTATVWPDCIIALNLLAEPDLSLDPASPFRETLTSTDHNPLRVGEFEYNFTLTDLRLEHRVDGDWESAGENIDAAMWYPTSRPAFGSDADSSMPSDLAGHGAEVRSIGLLSWDPIPWSRALVPGFHPGVDDAITGGVNELCEDHEGRLEDCAIYHHARPGRAADEWMVRAEARRADVFANTIPPKSESLGKLITKVLEGGEFDYVPLILTTFPAPIATPTGMRAGALRVGQFIVQRSGRIATASTLATRIDLIRPQYEGVLRLLISNRDREVADVDRPLVDASFGARLDDQPPAVVVLSDVHGDFSVKGRLITRTVFIGNPEFKEVYSMWEFHSADSGLDNRDFNAWHVPPANANVLLLETCGYDERSRVEADVRNANRETARERLNEVAIRDPATPTTAVSSASLLRFVMQSDSNYRVVANWEWTGQKLADPVEDTESERKPCTKPPRTGTVEQIFTFRTANEAVSVTATPTGPPTAPSADNADIDFTVFDVRDLDFYIKEVPSFDDPPLFTESLVYVEYYVDHVELLLQRYGRSLDLSVVRTDGPAKVEDTDTTLTRFFVPGTLGYWEQVLFLALQEQPCITGELPPQSLGEYLDFDLEPNARYDFLITGPKATGSEPLDRHLIKRSPFRTSRYEGPLQLFAALGFGSVGNPLFYRPYDQILSRDFAVSLDVMPDSDVELEAGLRELNLIIEQDETPKTTILWQPPLPRPATPPVPTLRGTLQKLRVLNVGRVNVPKLVNLVVIAAKSDPRNPGRLLPALRPGLGSLLNSNITRSDVGLTHSLPPLSTSAGGVSGSTIGVDSGLSELPTGAGVTDLVPRDDLLLPLDILSANQFSFKEFGRQLTKEHLGENGRVLTNLVKLLHRVFRKPGMGGISRAEQLLGAVLNKAPEPARPAKQNGWRVRGVLLESNEPILRDGNLDITALQLAETSAAPLVLKRSNTSRSRLLFIAETPVELPVNSVPAISLTYQHTDMRVVADILTQVSESVIVEHVLGLRPQTIDWEV